MRAAGQGRHAAFGAPVRWRLLWPRWQAATPAIAAATLGVLLAWLARHGLVEPADLTARCDAARWDGAACVLRTLVVQSFIDQRIAWVSVAAGLLANTLAHVRAHKIRWSASARACAWVGLASGAAGLVLYSAGVAAAGFLMSALACVDAGASGASPWWAR